MRRAQKDGDTAMNTKEINDLLEKIAEGDNKAFEEFYVRTKNGVYAFLRSYFYNHAFMFPPKHNFIILYKI